MSPIAKDQMPGFLNDVINDQVTVFGKTRSITDRNTIPEQGGIPQDDPTHWLKILDVVCVFVDMKGSTQLSARTHPKTTAGAYQLFTGTAVRLFHELQTPYIDVRGDGVFGLFNQDQVYRALAAAVTFKTFAEQVFTPKIRAQIGDGGLDIGAHIGIDQKTVLANRIGLRRYKQRDDRRNDVWAGKPVNMASKLAGLAGTNEVLVSDRYYQRISDEHARMSCGCRGQTPGEKSALWSLRDVSDAGIFDFETAWRLGSSWCSTHGAEYCEAILALDEA